MAVSTLSTIAQLLCYQSLPVNFAKLVGEVDAFLDQDPDGPFRASLDGDTTARFDRPGTRIMLAWSEPPGQGLSGILTLSVGPSPLSGRMVMRPDHDAMATRLVDQLSHRVAAEGILWRQMSCLMSPDWVDLLVEALPDLSGFALDKDQPARAMRHVRLPPLPAGRAGPPDRPAEPTMTLDPDLVRLRAALYQDDDDQRPSPQMRLAVHAMNATLIMVWMPLGAAALVHGMVRGEDMRLASRLMVLTGSVGAIMQTPMGQNMAALAGL